MRRHRMKRALTVMVVLLCCLATNLALALDVAKMSKEELLAKLGQQGVVVVDVRTGRDWKSSEFKIKGAVRAETDIVQWAAPYDKDTTLVLYCA